MAYYKLSHFCYYILKLLTDIYVLIKIKIFCCFTTKSLIPQLELCLNDISEFPIMTAKYSIKVHTDLLITVFLFVSYFP
jgi:hypothetical protein